MTTTNQPRRRQRRGRGAQLLSTLMFVAAIAAGAVAVWLYWDQRQEADSELIRPTSVPGQHDLGSIQAELTAAGLSVEIGTTTARTDQLATLGQLLEVEGQSLYVFIYQDSVEQSGVAQREAEWERLEPETLDLRTPSDASVSTEELHVSAGSNVIAVLVGGSDALVADVETAMMALS